MIVDTNRLIAATLRDSSSRRVLLCDKFEFYAPTLAREELFRHRLELLEKSGLPRARFYFGLRLVLSRVRLVDGVESLPAFQLAERVMEPIDVDDAPFVALALSIENDGIWTEDRHFEKQNVVRVWKTAELLGLI